MRRILATAAVTLALAPSIGAHPMGNFSVNRYARLEPSRDALRVLYIVDFAEIPTYQTISEYPDLSTTTDPATLMLRTGAGKLARILAARWKTGLHLMFDGRDLPISISSSRLEFLPGVGGLPTMKLRMGLNSGWPAGAARGLVAYRDTNESERLGWREVVLPKANGLRVTDADTGAADRSRELTNYPSDPSADIPQMTSATFRVAGLAAAPAPAASRPTPAAPIVTTAVPAPTPESSARPPVRHDRFADLIAQRQLTPDLVLFSLVVAFVLGGFHALSPGHGKTIVAAYLVGSRGTAKQALLLGLVVTASHTIGVFLLGLVTMALATAIVPEKLYPAIELFSGLSILAIGATLFFRRFRRGGTESHSHDSSGAHSHGDPDSHGHSHEIPEGVPTASALLALGVSGGILPCPSALVVLLSAIALHRVGFGMVLIVAFSMGLASVLSGIGLLVVRAGRLLTRFEGAGVWMRRLPAFSALLIGVLGLALAARALPMFTRAFFPR